MGELEAGGLCALERRVEGFRLGGVVACKQAMSSSKLSDRDAVAEISVLSKDEEAHHPLIQGVLSLTVNGCHGLDGHGDGGQGDNVYVKISVRGYVTRTRVVRYNEGYPSFDQTFNIPVTVVRNARHPYNWVRVEVFRFASVYTHDSIGSMSLHLHHIIQSKAVKDRFSLFFGEIDSGDIDLHLSFSYGLFGYGHSDQFKLEGGVKSDVSSGIEASLFPRVPPPTHRVDGNTICMAAKQTPHPDFIPFEHRVLFEEIPNAAPGIDEDASENSHVEKASRNNNPGEYRFGEREDDDDDEDDDESDEGDDGDGDVFTKGDADDADMKGGRGVQHDRYPHVRLRMTRLKQLKDKLLHIPGRLNRLAYLHQQLLVSHNRVETVYTNPFESSGNEGERGNRQLFMKHVVPVNVQDDNKRKRKTKRRTSFFGSSE
jgi:hypothetical protein